jgi:hypothetical protein
MEEQASRQIYELVLRIAAAPVLVFLVWLSWMIINRLMSPEWQRKRRSAQIRRAVAEREALMADLKAASSAEKPDRPS